MAFIFDLNGTMIDDMQYHVKAWHGIFNKLGAGIDMNRMKEECYGKNDEVIERVLPKRFTKNEKYEMSMAKETEYQREFRPYLQLIAGLDTFLETAYRNHIPMAIGSAAIMSNIDFVLDGLNSRKYFSAIVSADDVHHSKPHPETFLKCAEKLGVPPQECLVFEDTPKGVEAAANADMQCVVITLLHTREEFSEYENVVAFAHDYQELEVSRLIR
jgi:beta-phosphoglucomutase family hydrolase